MTADPLLPLTLDVAVPLRIDEIRRRGGPTAADLKKAQDYGITLASRGDRLLFRSKKKGETAELFNGLAHAVAVLAFLPGGVTLFDRTWSADV